MSWANAFDLGSCTVSVLNSGHVYYSGVLSKGGTSATFAGYLNLELLQVSVDASGAVSLDWLSGNGPASGYIVTVTPSYALPRAIQIAGISMPQGISGSANAQASDISPRVFLTTPDGVTWTPDPAVITDLSNQQYWSVFEGIAV